MNSKELNEFVLEEEKTPTQNTEYEMLGSSDDLDIFDFKSDKEFKIDEYHEIVNALKVDNSDESVKEIIKIREAKNIIEKDAKSFIDPVFVDLLSKEEDNLVNMIKRFDPNMESVRSMTEEQKDKIYDIAQYLFSNFQRKINNMVFIFPLTDSERKFIFNVFKNKLEYDQSEVFQLQDVKKNYLDVDFQKNSMGGYDTKINVNDLVIFYHLLSKYKVKGITQEHYDFLNILTKIGDRIKLFNAYNVIIQRMGSDFQIWGGALSVEGELTGKTLEPNDSNTEESSVKVLKENGELVVK